MLPVLSVGALKTAGTSTLSLTLASVTAAAGIPTVLVDAARDGDLADWRERAEGASERGGSADLARPAGLRVIRAGTGTEIEREVRAARRRGDAAIIDAGDGADTITAGARLADRALIPVRFSPLSAYAAIRTDELLAAEDREIGRPGRDRVFAASAVTPIPSRVARSVEALIARSATPRLDVGLSLRAAYEAPFLAGGTIFTLGDGAAPGLDRARAEAASLAYAVGLLGMVGDDRPAIDQDAIDQPDDRGEGRAAAPFEDADLAEAA